MLRGTNDSCSLLRHTLSQHSHPERRTRHDVSFIPPCDTRRESATILHSDSVSYCLLFFISSLPVDLSLDLAVSGFVCVCLSACSSVSHLKGMLLSWMHRLSRQWEEISFKDYTWHTHRDIQHAAYAGLFWGENTTESFVGKSHWQQHIFRKHHKSTRVATKS